MVIQRLFSLRSMLEDEILLDKDLKLVKNRFGVIARFLARFKHFRDIQEKLVIYEIILTSTGKSIGEIQLHDDIPEKELNIVWLEVNENQRGKHIATRVLQRIIDIFRKAQYHRITLEVPGSSPDARHIYEKLGFREFGTLGNPDDVWGGLTQMELILY